MKLSVYICVSVAVCANGGEVIKWHSHDSQARIDLYNPLTATAGVRFLQQAASQGDNDAAGDLSFAYLLGMGVTQDLPTAYISSLDLADSSSARAHTTLALLLSHNLTESWGLTDDERENRALLYYMRAAQGGDPLAQIIMGEHYMKIGDCDAALQHYRRAADTAMVGVREESIVRPDNAMYVWPEDSPWASMGVPSLDELQYLQYVGGSGIDMEAALLAAHFLVTGVPGQPPNLAKAAVYLQIAVEANMTMAMVFLASLHLQGVIPQDYHIAYELLTTALDQGNTLAHAGLGRMHLYGLGGLPIDKSRALRHFRDGASVGSVESLYFLGLALEDDPSKYLDVVGAWVGPASMGHVHSAYRLAELYRRRMEKDYSRTVSVFGGSSAIVERLCQKVVPLYQLTTLAGAWRGLNDAAFEDYTHGRITAALLKYLLLSDLGYTSAHVNAGRILDASGSLLYSSAPASVSQALKVWRRSAEAGKGTGYLRLGDHYYYGIEGVATKDLGLAWYNYQEAGKRGHPQALFNVAQGTEWGDGIPQDLLKARRLYQDVLTMEPDAEPAVFLTTLRIDTFTWLKDHLGLDFYSVDWWGLQKRHAYTTFLPTRYMMFMPGLAMVILGLLVARCFRRRQ